MGDAMNDFGHCMVLEDPRRSATEYNVYHFHGHVSLGLRSLGMRAINSCIP